MSTDRNGREIRVGDRVVVEYVVQAISSVPVHNARGSELDLVRVVGLKDRGDIKPTMICGGHAVEVRGNPSHVPEPDWCGAG